MTTEPQPGADTGKTPLTNPLIAWDQLVANTNRLAAAMTGTNQALTIPSGSFQLFPMTPSAAPAFAFPEPVKLVEKNRGLYPTFIGGEHNGQDVLDCVSEKLFSDPSLLTRDDSGTMTITITPATPLDDPDVYERVYDDELGYVFIHEELSTNAGLAIAQNRQSREKEIDDE